MAVHQTKVVSGMRGYQPQVSLKDHTTFKVGGPAEWFAVAQSTEALRELLATARAQTSPVTILGGGSNVLVSDRGIPGCVIKIACTGIAYEEVGTKVRCVVAAGENFDQLVADTVDRGYWGLENLSHIPGSVGATPIQNVGAYGVEVADRIESVTALHRDTLEQRTFSQVECQFGYRDSYFKSVAGQAWVVTAVTFHLATTPTPVLAYHDLTRLDWSTTPTPTAIRDAVIAIRQNKFPDWQTVGTAGSFFKNPIISTEQYAALQTTYPELPGYPLSDEQVKVPLGWILDKVCDLKGVTHDGVGTFSNQALVILHDGQATAAAIDAFAKQIEVMVEERTGITIAREVTMLP